MPLRIKYVLKNCSTQMEVLFPILTNILYIIHCLVKTWNLACCIPHPRGRTPCRVGEKQFLPILALLWSWLCLTCLSTKQHKGSSGRADAVCTLHKWGPGESKSYRSCSGLAKMDATANHYTADVFFRTVLVKGKLNNCRINPDPEISF